MAAVDSAWRRLSRSHAPDLLPKSYDLLRISVFGYRSSLAVSRQSHVVVNSVHVGFHPGRQCIEVLFVRHACGLDRVEDPHGCMSGIEELRTRSGDALCALDDNGKERETRVDGDAKGTLVKRKQFTFGAAGALRVHEQRVSALRRDTDTLNDGLSRGSTLLTVDLVDSDRTHGSGDQWDLEDLLLGEVPTPERQLVHQQWDIEHREMVRRNDVPLVSIDLLGTGDLDSHRRDPQEQPRPDVEDPVVDRSTGAEDSNNDDDDGKYQREKEEQGHENQRSDPGEQSAEHGR